MPDSSAPAAGFLENLLETYQAIPERTLRAIHEYVINRRRPGSFLRYVLSNDLISSVNHADRENRACLAQLVTMLCCEIPDECWGSPDRYREWVGERKPT